MTIKTNFALEHTELTIDIAPLHTVATGLNNPRGVHVSATGDLLVIEAGIGDTAPPFSGKLTKRNPETGQAEQTLLSEYRSMNMQSRMWRDEIMGLSDVTSDGNQLMVSVTNYVEGSQIIHVDEDGTTTPMFKTTGNINSLCYHPKRQCWYSVKPDTNEVIVFQENQPERTVCQLPLLENGREAVPVTVIYHPDTGNLLVSLFSGELKQTEDKKGIDFAPQAGQVVMVNPDTGTVIPVITGLTLPTGLALTEKDEVLVLELCDDFLQPLHPDTSVEDCCHGGFKRFSGRLLLIDLEEGTGKVLASNLDTPSNLTRHNNIVYISEGMGVPGRLIPLPDGRSQPLEGTIRKMILPDDNNATTS